MPRDWLRLSVSNRAATFTVGTAPAQGSCALQKVPTSMPCIYPDPRDTIHVLSPQPEGGGPLLWSYGPRAGGGCTNLQGEKEERTGMSFKRHEEKKEKTEKTVKTSLVNISHFFSTILAPDPSMAH